MQNRHKQRGFALTDTGVVTKLRHPVRFRSFPAVTVAKSARPKPTALLRSVDVTAAKPTGRAKMAGVQHHALSNRAITSADVRLNSLHEFQEEASRRIALRLHDESAQMLATVYMQLAEIARDCPQSTVQKIDRVVQHLDEVCAQLRGLSHELRPPVLDQLGLMPALQFLANGVRKRSGLELKVSGCIHGLSPATETVLYRMVQEGLSNVVRHAMATRVHVKLFIDGNMVNCRVSDNGLGYKPHSAAAGTTPGLGLAGIQERITGLNGTCRIVSREGQGMELQAEIPL